jgi:hypothetical protein
MLVSSIVAETAGKSNERKVHKYGKCRKVQEAKRIP